VISDKTPCQLVLEDGTVYRGFSFGARRPVSGEVVFNTGMTGYVESLTDPSYKGQILVLTYPLIGNYGVPREVLQTGLLHPYESPEMNVLGLVVSSYQDMFSHHAATKSLGHWLRESRVPAICGIDTRSLTRKLRECGTMRGTLCPGDGRAELGPDSLDMKKLVSLVSNPGIDRFPAWGRKKGKTVLLVDCGAKHNIIRSLLRRGVDIIRVPYNHDFSVEDFGADGILLSNGPGDPRHLPQTVACLKEFMKNAKPLFGICLGHQLLALAGGGDVYKLPYGHRSQNQPVRSLDGRQCFITSQNHAYAVDRNLIPAGFNEWFINVNDESNEGLRHESKPWLGVQFHPEAYPGPLESGVLFDEFLSML